MQDSDRSLEQDDPSSLDPRGRIAPSVSVEARAKLLALRDLVSGWAGRKPPETLAEFDEAVARGAAGAEMLGRATLNALQPDVTELNLGGTPTLEVRPQGYRDDGTALVYVHGGGFVQGSARSSLMTAALIASTSGRRVVSIDYQLSPRGTWATILEEVASAWRALLETGSRASGFGMIGDSAGGCIIAAAALLLRDRGVAMPGALVLLSPATDLAGEGDTNLTLASVDYLDRETMAVARRTYAAGADLKDPLVSPVHGDFSRGYPPVLTQVGTRELLLSDSVRLHRNLRASGQASRLEVYEGMPHVFQPLLADTPEGRHAWTEIAAFWSEHLKQ
jgi:monoterpene epsilon-lactone hydrolase